MSTGKKKSRRMTLVILWLLTAATALVVTIVYFDRLQDLYSTLKNADKGTVQVADAGAADVKEDTDEQNHSTERTDEKQAADINDTADELKPDDNIGDTYNQSGFADNSEADNQKDAGEDSAAGNANTNTDAEKTASAEQDSGIAEEGYSASESETAAEAPDETDSGEDQADSPDSNEESGHPYYYDASLDPTKPIIALSFDDGPSLYTERILAALETYGAKATFFMVGYNLDYYSKQVKAVYDAGCQIGNHTTDHKGLTTGTAEEIQKRVYDNEAMINEIVPAGRCVVRPPYGSYNDNTKKLIERPMFNWSVDSRDWESRNADSIVKEIKAAAKDGYIILMHDLYEATAEATERILPWLIEEGYQVTAISNMYEARGEETLDGHVYRYTYTAKQMEERQSSAQ